MSTPPRTGGVGDSPTVADRIRRIQQSLSPAELKLSRALLANYPAAGLESTNSLAQKVGISAPTVLRFIGRLGFGKYRDFQDALREEVQARRASPLTLPARITADSATSELASVVAETASKAIQHTFSVLPEHEFERAVALLCGPAKRITVFGGRFSHLLATYFDLHLRLMRPGTSVHAVNPHEDPGFVVDLGRRDVCVVFDFRRYQRDTIALAKAAAGRGAKIVLVTDPWLSPAADFADVVLSARVEAAGSFDSLVAATALVEALVFAVHARLGGAADERMRTIEAGFGDVTTE
ncbi:MULTISPECIES: MurR/RpiR family transcriptional regulator [Amycolatopsis]|uniref:DNA-binding transcriptional regulator, MurR/RpiR family, contains HTH and SIS domains n=2 Tax=Amycolatopsis TaxID=1813 RepID=A0A1I4BL00_9PSEU|nr:MurR/RpiR family transcriptional regulator [Amycolatopsis sacchari]SFK69468.1 DNA-binding transcriptional regulator, MurR/RpiR family, contains HTH and SIS domains [Amycolatopsis sacchari]